MGAAERPRRDHRRPALWTLVFAGPALRTSLLGALLVAQREIGQAFGLQAEALVVLLECVVFGGLLAVLLLPVIATAIGIRNVSLVATTMSVACLVAGMVLAPFLSAGPLAVVALFGGGAVLGIFAAALSSVTQALLNRATTDKPESRHSLQSLWSAGQPAGFIGASVLGGILVESAGWWAALAVPLAFALIAALSLLDRGIGHHADEASADTPVARELAVIVFALLAFEVWFTWGSLDSWLRPGVVAALLVAVAAGTIAFRELRASSRPVVSPAPYSVAGFAAATAILLIYQFPTTTEFEVLLLTELDKIPPETIGDRTAVGNIAQMVGTGFAAGLLYRRRIRLALAAGFSVTIVGLSGYALYPWWDSFAYTAATRALAGFGSGVLTPLLFVLALDRMPVSLQFAAGTWLVLAMIGGTEIGLAIFNLVLEVVDRLTGSRLAAYLFVEVSQVAVATVTAILAWLLVKRRALPLTVGVQGPVRR